MIGSWIPEKQYLIIYVFMVKKKLKIHIENNAIGKTLLL